IAADGSGLGEGQGHRGRCRGSIAFGRSLGLLHRAHHAADSGEQRLPAAYQGRPVVYLSSSSKARAGARERASPSATTLLRGLARAPHAQPDGARKDRRPRAGASAQAHCGGQFMSTILTALVNGAVVSVLVAAAVWLGLRAAAGRLNAATRYLVWWTVLVVTVLLPLWYLPERLLPRGPAADSRRMPLVPAGSRPFTEFHPPVPPPAPALHALMPPPPPLPLPL